MAGHADMGVKKKIERLDDIHKWAFECGDYYLRNLFLEKGMSAKEFNQASKEFLVELVCNDDAPNSPLGPAYALIKKIGVEMADKALTDIRREAERKQKEAGNDQS